MNPILAKAILVTIIAVFATEGISFTVRYLIDRPADGVTILMALVIPIIITMPIAIFVFRQTEKLNHAHAALIVANRRLAEKASRDHMTGLLNRESFLAQADVARASPGRGALLVIDVDHFKSINDRFGHPTGDEVLIKISQAIASALRAEDHVGRVGGEEFAAFLVRADLQEAMRVGQRVRGAVESIDFTVRGQQGKLALTVSVGGAVAQADREMGDLMRDADGCLYEAKRRGRNRVIIEAGLTVAA